MIVAALTARLAAASPIAAERSRDDVRALSSDAFGGRGPGEAGEATTIADLAKSFAAAGLQPGGEKGGWFQDVPLVRLDRATGATMVLGTKGSPRSLVPGRDAALSLRNIGATSVVDAPLAFAGFGIVDRANGRDAYAGIDIAGKIAVVLANDPDFEGGRDLGFEGRRMVYAGRVGAKIEAAARAGAVGAVVIHADAANRTNGPVAGDAVRNGAVDNATGAAEVREIARAFARGPRPVRTIVFAAWTAEEKGLLGSDYYAGHPLYPLATTAPMIDLDPHVVLPAARDIANGAAWPGWNPGNEYRPLRDARSALRGGN